MGLDGQRDRWPPSGVIAGSESVKFSFLWFCGCGKSARRWPSDAAAMQQDATFQIAVVQCASRVGEVTVNLATAARSCATARKRGAHLVLFPECHATGCSYRDLVSLVNECAEPLDGTIGQRLRSLAKEFSLIVCCGMFERESDTFYNTHVVAFPDGRLECQRKGVHSPLEKGLTQLEPRRSAFEWKGFTFGILVCADIALKNHREQFRRLGVDLVLHPSAGRVSEDTPHNEADDLRCLDAASRTAKALGATYAVANPIGFSGEDYYPGNSWVLDRDGEVLVHLPGTGDPERMQTAVGIGRVTAISTNRTK